MLEAAWTRSVPFDPSDPVALLEARRDARLRPFVSPDQLFQPIIEETAEQ